MWQNEDRYKSIYVLGPQADTLYKEEDMAGSFILTDFNSDGYQNILIQYVSNVPNVENLIMFDAVHQTFRPVEDFIAYPASHRLKNTPYCYSYSQTGCADYNWESNLFYIRNYKAIPIAHIQGQGCEGTPLEKGIFVSKVIGEKQMLIQTLPITEIDKDKDYKWGFIKKYWTKNYKKFVY